MSRTVQRIACGVLFALIIWPVQVFAQASYTWRNVQIYGGGFVDGIVFNQTEANLVYVPTDIGGAYRLDNATSRYGTHCRGGPPWPPLRRRKRCEENLIRG